MNKMDRSTVSSGMWLKFFTNAGIPESVSASYANKFAENRIKKDMIKDLTKDILRDMGVTCMGDIIAILRHAKEVYDEEIMEKVIGQSSSSVQTATVRPTKVSSGRKSSVASHMQEHHARRSGSNADVSPPGFSDVQNNSALPDRPKSSTHRETRSSDGVSSMEKVYRKQTRSGGAEEASYASRKRSESTSGGQLHRKADSRVTVKRKQEDEPCVKKVRKVMPEHKGGYKVTIPSETTTNVQELLKKKSLSYAERKKSVFDRLGAGSEEEVSVPTPIADTTFRVTGIECAPLTSANSNTKSSSVFSRLGDKMQQCTTPSTAADTSVQNPVPYHGILKQPNKKILIKRSPVVPISNSTMRADEEGQQAVRKKVTSITPSITPSITTVILPATNTNSRRLISGQSCTMRADEEVCLKVVGTSPVVKRLRTSMHQPVTAPVDKPVMRQIFRNKTTQGILAAPISRQKISIKSRLGVGSSSYAVTSSFVPVKKRVMFEKKEVSFMGASEKDDPSSQRSRLIFYRKPVKTEHRGSSSFRSSVFHRLGQNGD